MTRIVALALCALLTGICLSCSSAGRSSPDAASEMVMVAPAISAELTLPDTLPPLPDDAAQPQPLRQASIGLNIVIAGEDFHSAEFEVANGGTVQLTAPQNGAQWAIFQFPGIAEDAQISSISVSLATFSGGALYSMVSDYASGRWLFSDTAAQSGGQVLQLYSGPATGLVSPAGNLYVGLLAHDGASTVIDSLTLLGNGDLQPPANLSASDDLYHDKVLLSWDPAPGAGGYHVFYKLDFEQDDAYGLLTTLTGNDNTSFEHSASQPVAKPCVYAERYEYRVQSWSNSELSEGFSNSAVGRRILPAIPDFFVSDRIHEDRVSIIGYYPLEVEHISLRRNGVELIELGLTDGWFSYDDHVPDFKAYDYLAYAVGPEGESLPSVERSGRRVAWDHMQVALSGPVDETYADFAVVNGVPAIVYWQQQTETLHYAYADSPQPSGWTDVALPGTIEVNARMSLLEHNGVPWFLFSYENDEPGGAEGVVLVYSSQPAPTVPSDFNNGYLLYDERCEGLEVKLRRVDGRLAALFMDSDRGDADQLVYAEAGTTMPQLADWQFSTAGQMAQGGIYNMDLEELDGRPCVVYQTNDALQFNLATVPSPAQAADWNGHAPLTGMSGIGLGSDSGVDLVVNNGLPHIACCWGQLETNGTILFLMPFGQVIPVDPSQWTGGTVADLTDKHPSGISMTYLNDIPFICWTDRINGNAWLASAINPQPGYLGGFWNLTQLPGEPGFSRAWRPSAVLSVDDGLGVFYSSENEDLDPDQLETIYAWWLPQE